MEGCGKIWFSTTIPPGRRRRRRRKKPLRDLFQQCLCIHNLLLWLKFHWKIPLGKWFFIFLPKLKWCKTNRPLGTILKRYFLGGGIFFKWLVYKYIKYSIHHKITTGKWFLGSHGGPPTPTGGKYLGHLSGICEKLKVCRVAWCCYTVNNKPN